MNIYSVAIFLFLNFLVYRFLMYYAFHNQKDGLKMKVLLDIFGFILFVLLFVSMFLIFDGYFTRNITHLSVGFSGFAAFGTVLMAFFTWKIIVQNKEEHQESHKPYCVLVSNSNSSLQQDWIFGKSMTIPGVQGTYVSPTENCIKIKNIGAGPALDIKVEIRREGKEYIDNPLFNVTPIAQGELPYEIDLGNLPKDYFERYYIVYIEYKDIFGNIFEGVYPGKHGEDITLDIHTKKPVNSEYEIVYQRVVK